MDDEPVSKSPEEAKPVLLSEYDRGEDITIDRRELKDCPYNPRTLSDNARRKLKAAIKKNGLVGGLCWNRRTGELVGGHQRIKILDLLHRTNEYAVRVRAIDVDEKTQKTLIVGLNNPEAQGDFDLGKLEPLLKEIDLAGAGFDAQDVYGMFGIGGVEGSEDEAERLAELAEKLRGMRERDEKQKSRQKNAGTNPDILGWYRVVVFETVEEACAWDKLSGVEENNIFLHGRGTKLVRVDPDADPEDVPTEFPEGSES